MADNGEVRVLTQNLFGRRGDWPARRRVLAAGLRALSPDLMAFQESVVTGDYDQVADLLGGGYHCYHQQAREAGSADGDVEAGQGISIASRWPLRTVDELDLHVTPRTAGFACTTLVAEIDAPAPYGPLLFVHHLPSFQLNQEYERELQAVLAARFIEDRIAARDVHVVLAGDLDADPAAASVRFWTGRQALERMSVCYRDAWERAHPGEAGTTFTHRNPLRRDHDWPFGRIEYIFVRCGEHGGPTLAIDRCELAFAEPVDGVWASDHFGVLADLSVPPPF
jgi:endonuclease/exonuclease/phosphatase family metal-dependent hydrolase